VNVTTAVASSASIAVAAAGNGAQPTMKWTASSSLVWWLGLLEDIS
jgi:hypothetical protein